MDVIIASELLEAGRTIETDYASPGRTTVIASTHRLFSIAEKSAPGDGVFPREALEAAARALSRRFVGFDGLALARRHQTEVNALLLGALAASEIVPMTAADFEAAIREGGVAVDRNVRGLKAGVELVAAGPGDGEAPRLDRPWADVKAERAGGLGARGAAFLALAARAEAEFPEPLHAVLGEALARLVDYQDARYAELFLERVRRVRALDAGRPAHAGLRAPARGVDDLRGRDPRGRPEDPPRALRAHPPGERGARGLGPGGHRLPQARPRRAVRHPARRRSAARSPAGPSGGGPTAVPPSASTSAPPRCSASSASGCWRGSACCARRRCGGSGSSP